MKKIKTFIIIFFTFLFYNSHVLTENSDKLYKKIDIFIDFLYIFHIKEKNSELLNWMQHN